MNRKTMFAAFAALLVAACSGDSTGPEDSAALRIRLTDAPADYIESAEIWVSAIYVQRGADDNPDEESTEGDVPAASRVYLFDDADNPLHYDLMTLRDGVTADLTGDVEIEPGVYSQLRMIVDSAFVTLKEGYEFNDGGMTAALKVPSGASSGLKVKLAKDIEAAEGETVDLLVDFDVNDNFKLQGNPDTPAGIHGILFTPVLKEKSRVVEEEGEGV